MTSTSLLVDSAPRAWYGGRHVPECDRQESGDGVTRADGEVMTVVSAKVPRAQRGRLERLASAFPMADGSRGNLSAVLRTWLDLGEVLYEAGRVRRVRELAQASGSSVAETWGALVDEGLRVVAERTRPAEGAVFASEKSPPEATPRAGKTPPPAPVPESPGGGEAPPRGTRRKRP